MNTWVDRIISGVLALAAVVIAFVLVRREVGARSASVVQSRAATTPTLVDNWPELLARGTRIGDPSARVQIVEFADFECSFCRTFAQAYSAIKHRYPRDVSLIFISLPLQRIHRFALPAARAAACAAQQGRFAAFHDIAYAKQDSFGLKSWASYALEAGVPDSAQFGRCNSAVGPVQEVVVGETLSEKLGIRATPTVIINGWRFPVPPSDSVLARVVAGLVAGKDISKLVVSVPP